MHRLSLVVLIVFIFLLSGCASNSPWDGMPYNEATSWRSIGVSAHNARQYRNEGFAPDDVQPWSQAGIKSPKKVFKWYRAGFSPNETAKWLDKGFSLEKAIELKKQGLTVSS